MQAGLARPSIPFNNAEDQVKTEHLTLLLVAAQQRAGLGKAAADTDQKLTDDRIKQMSEHLKDQIVRLNTILIVFLFPQFDLDFIHRILLNFVSIKIIEK